MIDQEGTPSAPFSVPFRFAALILLFLSVAAQTTTAGQRPAPEPLALPSFSIFELSPSTVPPDVERKYKAGELAGMRSMLEKNRADAIQSTTDETVKARAKDNRLFYYIVPITFYASRRLFEKEAWTVEEAHEGQQLAAFIAWLAGDARLAIGKTDRHSFRSGLARLRNWFAMLCRENKMLPAMMFLADDLFFGGEDIDHARFSALKVVTTTRIPDMQASFVVLSDGATPEPLIIGVVNSEGKPRWLRRYSAAPLGNITSATAHEDGIKKLDEHGYVCWLLATSDFATAASRIYLDESLNLRFYYLSW